MTGKGFGSDVRRSAVAAALAAAAVGGCANSSAPVARRQQAAASPLPGYTCAPSPAGSGETICTRRAGAARAASGPAARFGRLPRSAAVATYPAGGPAHWTRLAPFTGPIGVILPRLETKSGPAPAPATVEPPADAQADQVHSAR